MPENARNIEIGKKFIKIKQKVKISKELKGSNMDFTLWDNKLAITSFENQLFIVVIESEELIKSMRPIFNIA